MNGNMEKLINKKETYNHYWRRPDYLIDLGNEKVSMRELYERITAESKKLFEDTKKLNKESIPEGKFVLYINNVLGGPVKNPEMENIDKDRYELMIESETGSKNTSKDDFQRANMQYCLGFETGDSRFKEFIPFDENQRINDIDFANCVGVVLSGSEMNVLEDTDEIHKKATVKARDIIKAAKEKGVPIMGICFGGQLLANENGARIEYVKDESGKQTRMIGAQNIKVTAEKIAQSNLFPELEVCQTVVENHGQQMGRASIFNRGKVLAENPKNHAPEIVLFGKNEVALQFHPEVGSLRVEAVTSMTGNPQKPDNILKTDLISTRKIFFTQFLQMVKDNMKS